MKQPFWKVWLSYFKDVHIESEMSIYNDELQVLLVRGEYQLVTPEAIYSYGKLYDNYYQAFKQLDIKNRKVDDVLILGLGLGSIPYMLEKYFHQNYNYTAVEIDESIIHLASKYVLGDLRSEITTICTDAAIFIQMDRQKYDLVAMDVFVSDYIPEKFESLEYLQNLKECIADKGLLLFNRLYLFEKDKKKTKAYFQDVFLKVFPKGKYLEINGNWMLVGML